MKLSSLLRGLDYTVQRGNDQIEIENLCYDSTKVKTGDVFICIKGSKQDGHCFIDDAISKGAKVLIVSREVGEFPHACIVKVSDTEKALAVMSANYFGRPAEKLKLIGVTGTKGKTSVSFMLRSILTEANIKCGLIGTIEVDNGAILIDGEMTTPTSYIIQKTLSEMVNNNCKWAVIEVSSQGLMKSRVYGLEFQIGIFTNIYLDHIGTGEHNDFEEYLYWKGKLFDQCIIAIVNRDNQYTKKLLENRKCKVLTFGTGSDNKLYSTDVKAVMINGKLGTEFNLKGVYDKSLVIPIAGQFTPYNVMAAVLTANQLGIQADTIEKALENLVIPGRQQVIQGPRESFVIVDYAHNGKALESLLMSLRQYAPERIITIFGCGGSRSIDRRHEMGEISGRLSDYTIITSDNPRNESPFSIINDIIEGINKTTGRFLIDADRKSAIHKGILMAEPGDFIVIAGKGHEKYQILGDNKIYFDDVAVAMEIIEKVKNG